jgi:hypothetical protein
VLLRKDPDQGRDLWIRPVLAWILDLTVSPVDDMLQAQLHVMNITELCLLDPPPQAANTTLPSVTTTVSAMPIICEDSPEEKQNKILKIVDTKLCHLEKEKSPNLAEFLKLNNIKLFIQFQKQRVENGETNIVHAASLQVAALQQEAMRERKWKENWKGIAYAKRLCKNSESLYQNGCLLVLKRGKGGKHAFLLDHADVKKGTEDYKTSLGVGKVYLSHCLLLELILISWLYID